MMDDETREMPPGSPDGYKEFGVAVTRPGAGAIADIVAGRPGGGHAVTDDELARFRDHAIANPSHAGDVVLRLVAEVARCRREIAVMRVQFAGAAEMIAMHPDRCGCETCATLWGFIRGSRQPGPGA